MEWKMPRFFDDEWQLGIPGRGNLVLSTLCWGAAPIVEPNATIERNESNSTLLLPWGLNPCYFYTGPATWTEWRNWSRWDVLNGTRLNGSRGNDSIVNMTHHAVLERYSDPIQCVNYSRDDEDPFWERSRLILGRVFLHGPAIVDAVCSAFLPCHVQFVQLQKAVEDRDALSSVNKLAVAPRCGEGIVAEVPPVLKGKFEFPSLPVGKWELCWKANAEADVVFSGSLSVYGPQDILGLVCLGYRPCKISVPGVWGEDSAIGVGTRCADASMS